jgi:hypothetical protein
MPISLKLGSFPVEQCSAPCIVAEHSCISLVSSELVPVQTPQRGAGCGDGPIAKRRRSPVEWNTYTVGNPSQAFCMVS